MTNYYIEKDNKILLFDEDKQQLQDTITFMPQYQGLEIKEVQEGYVIYDFELMTVEEKEEMEAQKERERLDMLYLTGADVERGIYQAIGKDFEDIIELVETLQFAEAPQVANIDLKALKIELKANHFYRGNPYVSAVGTLLGFTSEQLDKFFETKDYHELLPVEPEEPEVEDTNANTTDTTESDISI